MPRVLLLPAGPPADSRRRLRTSLLIGLSCLVIYNANLRSISAGDTYPARYLPFAIVQYHTLFLNPVAKVTAQGRGDGAFWMLPMPGGHLLSLYPVATPLLVAPLYVPAVAYLHWRGWTDARLDFVAKVMEKLAASLIAALSAALLYVVLRRRTSQRNAVLLTCAYAFGTTTWVVSSQALWQHGTAQLLIVVVLLLLTAPPTTPRAALAGLVCGLIAANRPPDVVLAAALGMYALVWAGRRRWPALIAPAALPLVLLLLYNFGFGGNFFGGYGVIGKARFFSHALLPGIAGLLVSPARGLLVFSPFFLFLLLGFRRPLRERGLTLILAAAVIVQVLLYAKVDWRAGLSWGPRYMTDLLPFLMWMLVPVVERLRTAGRVAFVMAIGVAVAIEAIGAFMYHGSHDQDIFAVAEGPRQMDAAFAWRNAPFFTSLKHGLAAPDLAVAPAGYFDAVEVGADGQAAATGWALAGHHTPSRVAVIVDGRDGHSTSTFTDRPDVRETLHAAAPSGWRIPIDTSRLAPGEHRLTAMVWTFDKGEGHYLSDQTLTIRDDSAATAAARIRAHQRPEGFWLTAYTSGTRYVDAHPEMNTFLTALLVDLLEGSGLDDSVRRARAHLAAQIEPGGLVRYHGLPDAPWIGTLGCAITPDTDDTALVWRIAPGRDRRELAAALATIDRYRTPDGLYRSWLAPRDAYQCLDPGRDPNPADIAIQMHMLLLLAKERPAGARALCDALRRFAGDDRIWVYYRRTPLVPMLRVRELRNAGCALALPESRMRTEVEGQAIWIEVARMLGSPRAADATRARAVLRELARDDFALVRTNPPLLYHNDLTATVPRFYWSEDAGYALWLALDRSYGTSH